MTSDELKKILIPTPGQLLVCLGFALLLVGVLYYDVLAIRLLSIGPLDNPIIHEGIAPQVSSALANLNHFSGIRTLVIAFFWGLVGLIAYLLYLAATNTVTEARNELVIETAYTNKGRTEDRVKPVMRQLGAAFGLVIALVLTAAAGLPLWLGWFETFLVQAFSLSAGGFLVASVVGLVINFYLLWTIGQIVFDLA